MTDSELRDRPDLGEAFHGVDDAADCARQIFQRCQEFMRVMSLTYAEAYRNGYRDLEFVFSSERDSRKPKGAQYRVWAAPHDVSSACTDGDVEQIWREVGGVWPNQVGGNDLVVCRWQERPVFVDDIGFMQHVQQLVPSRLTVRLEAHNEGEEICRDPMGTSVFDGSFEPCLVARKGELRGPFPLGEAGLHNGEEGMIQCGSELVENIASDQREFIYDGFVGFGVDGSLQGLCIGFQHVAVRPFTLEKLGKLTDVLLCPIDLEVSTFEGLHA